MNKQETIQYLTDLMATVQAYYFKGRIEPQPLRISESLWTPGQIGIDLYNFGCRPVCDGLQDCPVHHDDGTEDNGHVFAMYYTPDEETPLTFIVDFEGLPEIQVDPDDLPEDVLKNITGWLEKVMQPKPVDTKSNQVTAFMFYMWNAWCESECRLVWKDNNWKHFWDKWCGICKAYGTHGAAERFYAELSHGNRNLLVQRAVECFEGDMPKLKF